MLTPRQIFGACFTYVWLSYSWKLYLSIRQYRKQKRTVEPPSELREILDADKFAKARLYKLDRAKFGFFSAFVDQIETTIVLLFDLIPALWRISGAICVKVGLIGEIYQSMWAIAIGMIISTVLDLPLSYISIFVIEEKHGFNKQTVPFFIKDSVKKLLVSLVITLPATAVLIWIIKIGGDYFLVYATIFLTTLGFFIMTIYPEFIAPLFDKYTLLPDGDLKKRIEDLASRVAYPLKKIFVVEGSKRSSHSNAYLYGIWNNKRIVLYDTLLADYKKESEVSKEETEEVSDDVKEKVDEAQQEQQQPAIARKEKIGMCDDEVLAVVGHELGHWKLWHNIYNIIICEISVFVQLGTFALLHKQHVLYNAFGFYDEYPIVIGLTLILQFIFAPVNELLEVLLVAFTRRMEFAADQFSAALGFSNWMKSALVKLSRDNLIFPVDDWLYSAWHYSHPPVPERLQALSKFD
uniref:CAAX prenyl protease n=1 Tax=Trichuris muris TaxID=70415 RepID=A0A5S6QEB7_TRIMR